MANKSAIAVRILGIASLLSTLAVNPWTLERVFLFDRELTSRSSMILYSLLSITLIAAGLMALVFSSFVVKHRKNILLMSVSVALTFLVVWGAMLRFYAFNWDQGFVSDPIRHHRVIPNTKYRLQPPDYENLEELHLKKGHHISVKATNDFGFPDKKIKAEGKAFRILLLGDSFTEGQYIENNFADLLENRLNASRSTAAFEVINAGMGSYSPAIERNIVKSVGLDLHPGIIILNLDMTDVSDDYKYARQMEFTNSNKDYTFKTDSPAIFSKTPIKNLLWQLKLALGVWHSAYVTRPVFRKPQESPDIQAEILALLKYKKLHSGQIGIDPAYAYSYKNETEFIDHLHLTLRLIAEINGLSKSHNITFVLHTYPHSPQISTEYDCYRDSMGLERNKIYSNKIFDELELFAKDQGITLWLSNDVLKNASRKPYYPCDMHFNQYGHELVADFLFRQVVDTGVLNGVDGHIPAPPKGRNSR